MLVTENSGPVREELILKRMIGREVQLPTQLAGTTEAYSPEHALVLAFFWRAMVDYLQARIHGNGMALGRGLGNDRRKNSFVSRVEAADAHQWFWDRDRAEPYSFLWTCGILGIDPDWLTERMERFDRAGPALPANVHAHRAA